MNTFYCQLVLQTEQITSVEPKINTYILSNSILTIYACEEFQVALGFNPETLLTTLGILP